MKYRKKPVIVEAITFQEFIDHIKETTQEPYWRISYQGVDIYRKNDKYYFMPTLEGIHNFTPSDMLITGIEGEVYPCKIDIFEKTYELIE